MIDYWSRVRQHGAPQAPGQPDWPTFGGAEREGVVAATGRQPRRHDFDQEHQCAFWASVKG